MRLTAQQWWRIGLLGAAFLLVGWIIINTWAALTPFIIGLVLAFVLTPVVDWLSNYMPRFLAILLIYFIVIVVLVAFFLYIVPIIVEQSTLLAQNAPKYVKEIQAWLTGLYQSLLNQLPEELRNSLTESINNFTSGLLSFVRNIFGGIFSGAFSILSGTFGFLLGVVLVPFWLFYVLKDKNKGLEKLRQILPENNREDAQRLLRIVSFGLYGYIRGLLFLALIMWVISTIGLIIIGFSPPTAIFLGFIVGLFEFLPILGAILATVPPVIVGFFSEGGANWGMVIKVIVLFVIIQQLEGNLLVPKVSGDSTKLHPAIVMILVIVGSEIGGIAGAIAIVPLTAVIRDVYVYLYQRAVLGATPEQAEFKTPGRQDDKVSEPLEKATVV